MQHSIISERKLPQNKIELTVNLIPENDREKIAIKNIETFESNENDREMINNYIQFGLGSKFSILGIISKNKSVFILEAFDERHLGI